MYYETKYSSVFGVIFEGGGKAAIIFISVKCKV